MCLSKIIMDKLYIELKGTIIALCIWAISCALTEFVSWLGLPNYCASNPGQLTTLRKLNLNEVNQ